MNYWQTKSNALYYIEDVFNGDFDTSLAGVMGNFFNALQEVSKNPTDEAIRTALSQETKKLTDVMHTYYNQMVDLMYQQDYAMARQVEMVNQISQKIVDLNMNILKYEQGGNTANDLRDARNLLIDELSSLADIQYEEVGTGRYNINGVELTTMNIYIGVDKEMLVEHMEFRALKVEQIANNDVIDEMEEGHVGEIARLHRIRFEDDDSDLELSGGMLKGYLDIRDGNEKTNQGIPYFIAQLNEIAKALVETFNDIHMRGWTVPYTDKNGFFHDTTDGIAFFDPNGTKAGTIRLSEEVIASGFNIAASSLPVNKDSEGHFNTGNNEIALELIRGVKERNDIPIIGSFEGFFKSYLSELAAEAGHAKQMETAEMVLVDSLSNQRLSIMGVSLDEEMTNLVRFQHAYNAAARTITAMDEMLEVLINRTGRAGL
jgi:flagellar hook-associated protein 1 FlgK